MPVAPAGCTIELSKEITALIPCMSFPVVSPTFIGTEIVVPGTEEEAGIEIVKPLTHEAGVAEELLGTGFEIISKSFRLLSVSEHPEAFLLAPVVFVRTGTAPPPSALLAEP